MRTALTVLAVALGVAAVLAIELAGDAAAGSFRSSMETLIGKRGLRSHGDGRSARGRFGAPGDGCRTL